MRAVRESGGGGGECIKNVHSETGDGGVLLKMFSYLMKRKRERKKIILSTLLPGNFAPYVAVA